MCNMCDWVSKQIRRHAQTGDPLTYLNMSRHAQTSILQMKMSLINLKHKHTSNQVYILIFIFICIL